jgi:hypothetical protein
LLASHLTDNFRHPVSFASGAKIIRVTYRQADIRGPLADIAAVNTYIRTAITTECAFVYCVPSTAHTNKLEGA